MCSRVSTCLLLQITNTQSILFHFRSLTLIYSEYSLEWLPKEHSGDHDTEKLDTVATHIDHDCIHWNRLCWSHGDIPCPLILGNICQLNNSEGRWSGMAPYLPWLSKSCHCDLHQLNVVFSIEWKELATVSVSIPFFHYFIRTFDSRELRADKLPSKPIGSGTLELLNRPPRYYQCSSERAAIS
jgi:hypothetical protein